MIGAIGFLAIAATGCGGPAGAGDPAEATFRGEHPIHVVCTTGMVADVVRNVGGEHVDVEALMGPGIDPHLYKPSPGDIARLAGADLIVYSGLHLEGKMAEVFERMARRTRTVAAAEGIEESKLIRVSGGVVDPHVWFDVALWSETVGEVLDVLAAFDPPHADDYRANADRYETTLAELDSEVRSRIEALDHEKRVLVTAHDAFGYFGRAYGVEVRGIQGISTESEAGVREVNQLVDLLVDRGVKAVFVESSVSDRNIAALVEGCGARGHEVRIGGQLYSDAMGPSGTPDGTYVGMVRHNVETIVEALQ